MTTAYQTPKWSLPTAARDWDASAESSGRKPNVNANASLRLVGKTEMTPRAYHITWLAPNQSEWLSLSLFLSLCFFSFSVHGVLSRLWKFSSCMSQKYLSLSIGTLCKYVVDMSYIEFICLPLCSYILPHWNGQHLEESEGHGSSAKNNNIINAPAPGNTYHLNTAAFPISPSSSNKHWNWTTRRLLFYFFFSEVFRGQSWF